MLDARLSAPAVLRNRGPLLEVLRRVLPARGTVVEIASGTGEHAAFFAGALPHLIWQPSDVAADARASIAAWCRDVPSVRPPVTIDAATGDWPLDAADAIVCINMIHIAPWAACEGLLRGAGRTLRPGGVLVLYGPYRVGGAHTAPSNEAFDADLRQRNPAWGVRDLETVIARAGHHGLAHRETVAMPANNLSLVFDRTDARVSPPPTRS